MAGTFGHQMGEGVGSTPRNSATARSCPAVDLSSGTTHLECRVPHNCWGRQHPRLAPVPGGWQAGAGESPTHRRHGSGAWWEPWRWSQGAGKSRLEVGLDRHRNCQGDGGKACRQRGQLHAFGAAGYQGAAQEGIKGVVSIRAAPAQTGFGGSVSCTAQAAVEGARLLPHPPCSLALLSFPLVQVGLPRERWPSRSAPCPPHRVYRHEPGKCPPGGAHGSFPSLSVCSGGAPPCSKPRGREGCHVPMPQGPSCPHLRKLLTGAVCH